MKLPEALVVASAAMMTFAAMAEKTAKVVVEDGDNALRFVYDEVDYDTLGMDWFSVAEAEAINPDYDDVPWYECCATVTKVVFDPSFADYRPTQCACWFLGFEDLVAIENLENLDTSSATSMAYMFLECSSLKSLDVSGFDTANVTDMHRMFDGCSSLASLDVSGFDTSMVTDMDSMFYGCWLLTSLDVSSFDTSSVTDMRYMFGACSLLKALDISGFEMSNVTDVSYMFYSCSYLKSLEVSDFDVSKVMDMSYMFYGCSSLTSLDLSNFDTSKVTSMYAMFGWCTSLKMLNLSGFDTAEVVSMRSMFRGCSTLNKIYVSDRFQTMAVKDSADMFDGCRELVGGNGTSFDSEKTDMAYARIDKPGQTGYFSEETYVIRFDGGGDADGEMADQVCAVGKVYNLCRCAFTKSGAKFVGWAGSNGRRYDDGVLVFDLAKFGKTVTMTAIWE